MYAVIDLQGHQYIINKGMDLTVDKLVDSEKLSDVKVMMVFDEKDDTVMLGTPYLQGVRVDISIKEPLVQDDKIRVIKFRRKNRYTRTIGHRSKQSILHITNIQVDG